MKKNDKKLEKLSGEQLERFAEAKKDLQKLKKELAPFIKKKVSRRTSSIAEWRKTSDIITYGS
jgi:hypothetical protein